MEIVDAGDMELLTPEEAARRIRVSPKTVRRLCYSRALESVKVGKLLRIPPSAVASYIGKLRGTQSGTGAA